MLVFFFGYKILIFLYNKDMRVLYQKKIQKKDMSVNLYKL